MNEQIENEQKSVLLYSFEKQVKTLALFLYLYRVCVRVCVMTQVMDRRQRPPLLCEDQ